MVVRRYLRRSCPWLKSKGLSWKSETSTSIEIQMTKKTAVWLHEVVLSNILISVI